MPKNKHNKLNTADLINRLEQKNNKFKTRTKILNNYEKSNNLTLSPGVIVINRRLSEINKIIY